MLLRLSDIISHDKLLESVFMALSSEGEVGRGTGSKGEREIRYLHFQMPHRVVGLFRDEYFVALSGPAVARVQPVTMFICFEGTTRGS